MKFRKQKKAEKNRSIADASMNNQQQGMEDRSAEGLEMMQFKENVEQREVAQFQEDPYSDTAVAQLEEDENMSAVDQDYSVDTSDQDMSYDASLEESPQEETINMEPMYFFTYQGQQHALTETEFEAFKSGIIQQLSRNEVLQMRLRVGSARSLWNYFTEINDDQYIVSWLVELTRGVDLPPESFITSAEAAFASVEAAMATRNLTNITNAIRSAEGTINNTLDTMDHYRESMISGAGNWVTGLQVTSTACFTIAAVAGGAVLTAPAAAGGAGWTALTANATMGGGTALLSSVSNEIGESMAGIQDGNPGWDIIKNTLLGAASGAIGGEIAKRLSGPAASAIVQRIGISAFGEMSEAAATEIIKEVLEGSFSSAFGGAISDAVGLLTGDQTWEGFLRNLVTNLIAGGFAGHLADNLPPSAQEHFRRLAL